MSIIKTYSDETKKIEIKLLNTLCPFSAVEQFPASLDSSTAEDGHSVFEIFISIFFVSLLYVRGLQPFKFEGQFTSFI